MLLSFFFVRINKIKAKSVRRTDVIKSKIVCLFVVVFVQIQFKLKVKVEIIVKFAYILSEKMIGSTDLMRDMTIIRIKMVAFWTRIDERTDE